jgi:hypothetical protein
MSVPRAALAQAALELVGHALKLVAVSSKLMRKAEELARKHPRDKRVAKLWATVQRRASRTSVGPAGGGEARARERQARLATMRDKTRYLNSLLQGRHLSVDLVTCGYILSVVMTDRLAAFFLEPVNAVALRIPDYHVVIARPMDLGTVRGNLESGRYATPEEFARDVRTTFRNATTYNPRGHAVHTAAELLGAVFEHEWARFATTRGDIVRMGQVSRRGGGSSSDGGGGSSSDGGGSSTDTDDLEEGQPVRKRQRDSTTVNDFETVKSGEESDEPEF